ncbi:CRISPR-associated endonuclease Cas2 [Methermicoccus shengliensis]|uniref:CRISPR-associated endonuclease Cas2 n=1 Tax=Methermicoccus shengliensis TaxID=660064 RepID=UPI0005B2B6AC|nr:CRISPR-associated endonuclease Cas2 [Methermicoccus shengliensis]
MYVIVVYDVSVDRVNRVKKFLRMYLTWIQNSVFEGELTEADFERVRAGLKKLIEEAEDMVVIYRLQSERAMKREVIGTDKSFSGELL